MQLHRIVIGMDFSDAAVAAARWIATQVAPDAGLVLAHVVPTPPRPHFGAPTLPPAEEMLDAAQDYATRRLHEVTSFVTAASARRVVRVGEPHEELVEIARETGADLIVVGQHGERPRPWKLLGTTAERLVRASPVPVLVAIAPPATPPRQLLAAVDDASVTPAVLAWSRAIADQFAGEVTLMHVLSNATYSHVTSMAHAHHVGAEEEANAEIRRELEGEGVRWLESLVEQGFEKHRASAAVAFGDPADALLTMAASMHAELMVLGRHGAGQVAPALLGSTLGTVLHGAPCPVLVVANPPLPA